MSYRSREEEIKLQAISDLLSKMSPESTVKYFTTDPTNSVLLSDPRIRSIVDVERILEYYIDNCDLENVKQIINMGQSVYLSHLKMSYRVGCNDIFDFLLKVYDPMLAFVEFSFLGIISLVSECDKVLDDTSESYIITLSDALIAASQGGHVNIIEYLIKRGATNLDDAMVSAATYGHLDAVKYLYENGATSTTESFVTASYGNNVGIMEYLYDQDDIRSNEELIRTAVINNMNNIIGFVLSKNKTV